MNKNNVLKKDSIKKEEDEIAHLMNIFVEAEEEVFTSCARCGEDFIDNHNDIKEKDKKIYCDKCLDKMWSAKLE